MSFAVNMVRLEDHERDFADSNRGLVYTIAAGMKPRVPLTDDVIQAGSLGLMRAAQGFDPSLGYSFSTYAGHWIRQAIRAHIADDVLIPFPRYLQSRKARETAKYAEDARRSGCIARIDRSSDGEEWTLAIASPLEDDDMDGHPLNHLQLAIDALPDLERAVIRRRLDGMTMKAIGAELGITREWVRQTENRAMVKLKRGLAAYAD